MKKLLALAVTALLAIGLAVLAVAAPASAHTPKITATCSQLSVSLSSYQYDGNNKTPNTVKVTIGTSVITDQRFGTTFSQNYSFPSTRVTHTYQVDVIAWDTDSKNNYNLHTGTVSVAPCPATVTVPSFAHTDPSCTSATGTYTVPTTAGISYSQTAGVHSAAPGSSVTVTGTATSGYVMGSPNSWSYTFPTVPTNCATTATPAAVTYTGPTCTVTHGSYVIPATTGVNYQIGGTTVVAGTYDLSLGASVSVTAAAASGYTLSGTASWGPWTATAATGCTTIVTPVNPTVQLITACGTDGSVTWTDTPQIHYALTTGNGTSGPYQVTATAQPGYTFTGGTTTFLFPPGDLGTRTTCATVPYDPTATDIVCVDDGDALGPALTTSQPASTSPASTKVGGSITVTPVTGVTYTITGGTLTTPIVITGKTGDPVVVTTLGIAGSYLVTPTAQSGYTLTNPAPITLVIVDTSKICLPTLPFTSGTVTATDQSCSSGVLTSGYISVALDPATLNYTLNGVQLGAKTAVPPGTYTVDMVPLPGYTIGSPSATVTVHASTAACGELRTLAFTGSNLLGYGALTSAALLLMAGGLFIQRSWRRSSRRHSA